MTLEKLQSDYRDRILAVASRRGATKVRIFGSTARGQENAESDLDLLVDLEPGRSLLDLGGLQMELQELLNCPVEVTTEAGLHWYLRDRVLREAVPL